MVRRRRSYQLHVHLRTGVRLADLTKEVQRGAGTMFGLMLLLVPLLDTTIRSAHIEPGLMLHRDCPLCAQVF